MSRNSLRLTAAAFLAAAVGSACSASQVPPADSSEILAPEAAVEVDVPPAEEPAPTARERWESPFAVTGSGRAVIRSPRDVLVLGADSAIAEGLALRQGSGRVAGRPDPESRTEPTSATAGPSTRLRPEIGEDEPAQRNRPSPAPSASAPRTGSAAPQNEAASTGRRAPVTLLGEDAPTTSARATGGTPAPGGGPPPRSAATPGGESTEGARVAATETSDEMMALHVVEAGENWSRIVIRYRVTSQALAAANPGVEQNQIKTGQILNIPIPPAAARARSHRVGPGDTLRGIATRYNVTTDEIRRLNAMEDERVTMGETLLIPPARTAEGDGR